MPRLRVALISGYFDWFGGYQETVLATALSEFADVEVIASDRVSPIFTDDHLNAIGVPRRYDPGLMVRERTVAVSRFPSAEFRSMVWSRGIRKYLLQRDFDLVVQAMPGQAMPLVASLASLRGDRVVLYGDNSAMWLTLNRAQRAAKWVAFSISKGLAYRFVNRRAKRVFVFTPNTQQRLRLFSGGKPLELMPLAYDPQKFSVSEELRAETRRDLGYADSDVVIMTAGKFQPQKKLEILFDVLTTFLRQNVPAKLLIVGADDGEYSMQLKKIVESNAELRERVTFLRFQDGSRLNSLFNAGDIGVWPVQPAISIQQAMGTGLLVALPQNELVGHLLRPGTGQYFKSGDPTSVATAIGDLIATDRFKPDDRTARSAVNGWLSAEGIARQLLGLEKDFHAAVPLEGSGTDHEVPEYSKPQSGRKGRS